VSDTLFDNAKPTPKGGGSKHKGKQPPPWVVRELIDVHGVSPFAVRKYHYGQAFAVLFRCRENRDPPGAALAHCKELSKRLTATARSEESDTEELVHLFCETLLRLDVPQRTELCRIAATLLVPPEPGAVQVERKGG
jgi:hypothetical protein